MYALSATTAKEQIRFGNVVPHKMFDVRFIDVVGIGLGLLGFFM